MKPLPIFDDLSVEEDFIFLTENEFHKELWYAALIFVITLGGLFIDASFSPESAKFLMSSVLYFGYLSVVSKLLLQ